MDASRYGPDTRFEDLAAPYVATGVPSPAQTVRRLKACLALLLIPRRQITHQSRARGAWRAERLRNDPAMLAVVDNPGE